MKNFHMHFEEQLLYLDSELCSSRNWLKMVLYFARHANAVLRGKKSQTFANNSTYRSCPMNITQIKERKFEMLARKLSYQKETQHDKTNCRANADQTQIFAKQCNPSREE